MAEYPRTRCKKHDDGVECFMACSHMVTGSAPAFYSAPPEEHPGLILCEACGATPQPLKNVYAFAPVRAVFAVEQGWIVRGGAVQ